MPDVILELRAELDVPGETGRQARVFAVWLASLLFAMVVSAYRRPIVPERQRDGHGEHALMTQFRRERALIAVVFGLALPALVTVAITHHRRRGGGHARGIVIDITSAGQLRVWGRGYGQRVALDGAEVSERLVDIYSGRLGAWRERRLSVRGRTVIAGSPAVLELATRAVEADDDGELALVGGEGDCIELARADYLTLLARIRKVAGADTLKPPGSRAGRGTRMRPSSRATCATFWNQGERPEPAIRRRGPRAEKKARSRKSRPFLQRSLVAPQSYRPFLSGEP
jgi:hypothetical protein